MENQKDQQQEETLSQESLRSLEEEQLQDVAGGGKWVDKMLSCLLCGGFKQQPESPVLSTGLNNVPATSLNPWHTPSTSLNSWHTGESPPPSSSVGSISPLTPGTDASRVSGRNSSVGSNDTPDTAGHARRHSW
jgi:hypothetical protein